MKDDVDSVKMTVGEGARAYHHGALREALIDAAESILEERGVEGFSLREAARRAGVSPAAPGHHFGDARGLLTAVATRAFRDFGDALEAGDAGTTRMERLRGIGMGWVSIVDPLEVQALLDVPTDWSLIAVLCVGYPSEASLTPELERHGWQAREPMDDRIFER